MLASILDSSRAIEISIFVVRAFVKLRQLLGMNQGFAQKLEQLERKLAGHDADIRSLVSAIRQLMAPVATPRKRIGFHP